MCVCVCERERERKRNVCMGCVCIYRVCVYVCEIVCTPLYVSVPLCVCVCEREREGERKRMNKMVYFLGWKPITIGDSGRGVM